MSTHVLLNLLSKLRKRLAEHFIKLVIDLRHHVSLKPFFDLAMWTMFQNMIFM